MSPEEQRKNKHIWTAAMLTLGGLVYIVCGLRKNKHIWTAAILTLGGLVYIVCGLLVQSDLNWMRAYDNIMYLLGKTAALTMFSLIMLWSALLINYVVPGDWFAIQDDMAIAVVWSSLLISMALAWAWG